MKKKIAILLILILGILLCSCSSGSTELTYIEDYNTDNAIRLLSDGKYDEFMALCNKICYEDESDKKENFFSFVALYFDNVSSENIEDEYKPSLKIISKCLELPLTQQSVIASLKTTYFSIDKKLTQRSEEYIIGRWQRQDETSLKGVVLEIQKNENGELSGKIVSVPYNANTTFKNGDIKWKDIHFANYETIYMFDMANSQTNIKTVSAYKGAVAKIDFDLNTITVSHDSDAENYVSDAQQQAEYEIVDENNETEILESDEIKMASQVWAKLN